MTKQIILELGENSKIVFSTKDNEEIFKVSFQNVTSSQKIKRVINENMGQFLNKLNPIKMDKEQIINKIKELMLLPETKEIVTIEKVSRIDIDLEPIIEEPIIEEPIIEEPIIEE